MAGANGWVLISCYLFVVFFFGFGVPVWLFMRPFARPPARPPWTELRSLRSKGHNRPLTETRALAPNKDPLFHFLRSATIQSDKDMALSEAASLHNKDVALWASSGPFSDRSKVFILLVIWTKRGRKSFVERLLNSLRSVEG
jgi:hypothetical protein